MAIVARTLQQMRQDLARMMDDLETGTADSGGTVNLVDARLNYLPDDHFNGYELTALFATPQSRRITDFTGTSGSIDFSPALTAATINSTVPYELHYEFRKLDYDAALNNAIRNVADIALVDKVDDSLIYRQGLQTYNIPENFVTLHDVQEMDNSDGIAFRFGIGSTPTDVPLGTSGIQNYLRLAQSILTNSEVIYVPAVALLLRNIGDTTTRSMKVAIYSDDGSGGPSAALYESSAVASSILDEIPRWIRFPFPVQAKLSANTRYHLVFSDGDTDGAVRYGWVRNQDSAYNSEKVYGYYSSTGVRQIETLTVVGSAPQQGSITVTVTAAGMPNSPVRTVVDVVQGDTATLIAGKIRTELAAKAPDVVNFFTIGGTGADVQLIAKAAAANDTSMNIQIEDGAWQGIAEVPFSTNTTTGATLGTKQVETATVVGTITAGTAQVETATVTLSASADANGTFTVIVTAAGMVSSPVSLSVSYSMNNTAANVAAAIRAAMNANGLITNFFTVSGSGANVILTAKTPAANDATMNIEIQGDGTVASLATSTNTTAGVASGAGTVSIVVTASGMTGTPVTSTDVDVLAGWTATQVASAIAAQLPVENANISNYFDITSSGAAVIFTRKAVGANDATMNIAINNGTCTGLTAAPTSANTTAGVAAATGTQQVETLTLVGTIRGYGLLRLTVTAANMSGSPAATAVYVRDGWTAADVAGRIRTLLNHPINYRINGFFTIGGTGANVVLTAKTAAADDTTMNIALANPTLAGVTGVAASANTTAGVISTAGTWASLSTTTAQGFVVYRNDPAWKSLLPSLWRVVKDSTRRLYVDKALTDGTPMRLLGLQAPPTMDAEDDKCPISVAYVQAAAAAALCASKIRRSDNDRDNYAAQTSFWTEKAEGLRKRIKTRYPANSREVEVQ